MLLPRLFWWWCFVRVCCFFYVLTRGCAATWRTICFRLKARAISDGAHMLRWYAILTRMGRIKYKCTAKYIVLCIFMEYIVIINNGFVCCWYRDFVYAYVQGGWLHTCLMWAVHFLHNNNKIFSAKIGSIYRDEID